jgi:outer membrane protein TolC
MVALLLWGLPQGVAGQEMVAQGAAAQGVERLSLEQVLALAQERSSALQALGHRVEEMESRSTGIRANYFPQLGTQVNYRTFESSRTLPEGLEGGLFGSFTTLSQPLTQLFSIRPGHQAAQADVEVARAVLRGARNDVAVGALQLYGGLLVARLQREAAVVQVAAAEAVAGNRQAAVSSGNVLEVAGLEARVKVLEARQRLVEGEGLIHDLEYQLTDLLGLPPGTVLELSSPEPLQAPLLSAEEALAQALRESPLMEEARATLRKAEYGVAAARADLLPQVGVGVSHLYQSSFSFLPRNSFGLGVQLNWALVDFGKRGSVRAERRAQLSQARANLRMVEGQVRGDVEKALRQLAQADLLVSLAREAHALRQEAARLQGGQERAGLILAAHAREADAAVLQGAAELLQAEMGYRLAVAELQRVVGATIR